MGSNLSSEMNCPSNSEGQVDDGGSVVLLSAENDVSLVNVTDISDS